MELCLFIMKQKLIVHKIDTTWKTWFCAEIVIKISSHHQMNNKKSLFPFISVERNAFVPKVILAVSHFFLIFLNLLLGKLNIFLKLVIKWGEAPKKLIMNLNLRHFVSSFDISDCILLFPSTWCLRLFVELLRRSNNTDCCR